jgi:hypothetical protein
VVRIAAGGARNAPCHQQAVGYRGTLPPDHPDYLAVWRSYNLCLNLVDRPRCFNRPRFGRRGTLVQPKYWRGVRRHRYLDFLEVYKTARSPKSYAVPGFPGL